MLCACFACIKIFDSTEYMHTRPTLLPLGLSQNRVSYSVSWRAKELRDQTEVSRESHTYIIDGTSREAQDHQ